jgi:6-phosphogluconolactonase
MRPRREADDASLFIDSPPLPSCNAEYSSPSKAEIFQRAGLHNGALSLIEQVNAGDQVNPMAITPDGKVLFAALRVKPFQVLGYRIDPKSGHLTPLSKAPLAESLFL